MYELYQRVAPRPEDFPRLLDKAASKGVIHKNQAANRKSAMATRCAELSKS